jgi:hypothetical protein
MSRSVAGLEILSLFLGGGLFSDIPGGRVREGMQPMESGSLSPSASPTFSVCLPLVLRGAGTVPARQINVPRLADPLGAEFSRMAIFWFGKVTPVANYADVRVAYTTSELVVYVAVFDRRLWFNPNPSPSSLTLWDAVTLFLHLEGNIGNAPTPSSYRFIGGLSHGDRSGRYQAAEQGTGTGWVARAIPFTAFSGWRGERLNDDGDDRGWAMTFRISFASLGRSSPPPEGTIWGLAVTVHDRDDAAGTPIPVTVWPESMNPNAPATWGRLRFGMPAYMLPPARPGGTVTIRHGLNGAVVKDAGIGGYTICGDGLDYWTQWGETPDPGRPDFNIQNQVDIADWPCFSKYYVIFPLKLTLHQFGNAGDPGQARPSWIQVLTVREDWEERTLTWNRAPLAWENIGGTQVDPVRNWPGWPGIPYTWDVTRAVAEAYAAGQPLRLALYSADGDYNSGKHFVSSDTGDWNARGRPTLTVQWGDPAP